MAKAKPKNTNTNNVASWHNDLFAKIIAACTIFGFGVATGMFINHNDYLIQVMQIKQEYNEKVNEEIGKSRDCKIEDQEKKINEIYKSVEILNKSLNEHK